VAVLVTEWLPSTTRIVRPGINLYLPLRVATFEGDWAYTDLMLGSKMEIPAKSSLGEFYDTSGDAVQRRRPWLDL